MISAGSQVRILPRPPAMGRQVKWTFLRLATWGETPETKPQQAALDGLAGSLTSAYMVVKCNFKMLSLNIKIDRSQMQSKGIQLSQISKMGVSPFEEQIDQATKGAR